MVVNDRNAVRHSRRAVFGALLVTAAVLGFGQSGEANAAAFPPPAGGVTKTALPNTTVHCLAFSPDGKLLAGASADKTVKLWDAKTGVLKRTLKGHRRFVRCVAFSPDGKLLATGSDDSDVRLWKPATGDFVRILSGHEGDVHSVAFLPDGKTLVSIGQDVPYSDLEASRRKGRPVASVRVWDVKSGKPKRKIDLSQFLVDMAVSPDGKTVAVPAEIGAIDLIDLASGKRTKTLKGGRWFPFSLAFSPDGKTLATGLTGKLDNKVAFWNVRTGKITRTTDNHLGAIRCIAFSPDGKTVAAGTRGEVKLWNAATGVLQRGVPGKRGETWAVAFSSHGKLLARSDHEGVEVFDTQTWESRWYHPTR